MDHVPEEYRVLFAHMADAMVEGRRHCKLPLRVLKGVISYDDRYFLASYLAKLVEDRTVNRPEGQLTVRVPERRVIYGYVWVDGFSVVLCAAGAPEGPVMNREAVLQAWVCTASGLLPADFDKIPDDALDGMN